MHGRQTLDIFARYAPSLVDLTGLEIGGPSKVFARGQLFPVYPLLGRLDRFDRPPASDWPRGLPVNGRGHGHTSPRHPRHPEGERFFGESSDLKDISAATYDVVLAAHALENARHPIRALKEWQRVLVPSGLLILVVASHRRTLQGWRVAPAGDRWVTTDHGIRREDPVAELASGSNGSDLRPARRVQLGCGPLADACVRPADRAAHDHLYSLGTLIPFLRRVGLDPRDAVTLDPFHQLILARASVVRLAS
jgi:SAM-dependent methyltransferase